MTHIKKAKVLNMILALLVSSIFITPLNTYAYRGVEDGIAWAENEVGSNWDNGCSRVWAWWCMHFAGHVYSQVPSNVTSAIDGWNGYDTIFGPRQTTTAPRGALVFFDATNSNGNYGHVGIAIGNGKMIHAWTTGVRKDNISFGGSYLGWRWPIAWTPDSGGVDPPGGGSGDADISIDKVEIKKTGESDSHFRHSFTVTSGNNNRLNIEAKVKNKKGDDVYADIYYYWDDDKHFSYKSSHKLGDDTHVKIDGHDDVKKHLGNVHIPDEPGSHYFYIYVKAPGDTDKSSSSNHDEYGKVTVLPQTHPDLVVQSPAVSNASLPPGQAFSVSAVVKNQGNGSSPGTTLRYYRSTNSNISRSDTQLATDSVSGLSPNGTSSKSATISAPTTLGTYWIGACVDNVNEESDTGNNCSSGVVITVNNPMHPDLVVQSPKVNGAPWAGLNPGQLFTVSAIVKNQGNVSSVATILRYYLSTNSTIDTNDSEIGTDTVDSLSAGNTSFEDKANRATPTTPGSYYVGACVDQVSGESDISNNCSTGVSISVNSPPYIPNNPSPSNGALGIPVTTHLDFSGGDPNAWVGDHPNYDVYLEANDSTPDNIVCNDASLSICNSSGELLYNTTYFWKVISQDTHGLTTTGPIWSFTTTTQPGGDINQDGDIDLTDAILGLQIISGKTPTGTVTLGADINEDSKIGIEEVIYILQKNSTSQ